MLTRLIQPTHKAARLISGVRAGYEREMKIMSEAAIIRDYPITGKLKGWYFKIEELSAGVYAVEGIDLSGRKVSRQGTDSDGILAMCLDDAKQMKEL